MITVAEYDEEQDHDEQLYSPDEAVLLLQDWFGRRSTGMTRENRSLIDDLVQEMSIGVLRCRNLHTLFFYKGRAVSRARDFLRREKREQFKAERYSRLSIPIMEDDDTPFIEGMVDLENKLSSRSECDGRITEIYPDLRDSA